jgi:membrane-anchored glycerophosphoryl diester phosphodiesterase (GDPDase)
VMMLDALGTLAAGRKPGFAGTVQAGLDAFGRVFWPVLIAVLCMAGTLITIVIPLVLLVRWFFVPQIVVLDGKRGPEALRESWELTRGAAWRVAGIVFVVQLLFYLAGALAATPLAALGRSLDSEAVALAATTLTEVLVAPPVGIFAALLYYDLRSRKTALARS